METVIISAAIDYNKRSELFQVMEPLKSLVKNYCKEFEIKVSEDNSLLMRITFDKKKDLEENFNNKEFNILRGSVKSLCNNVNIKINGVKVI
ncbi:MAG: hypothetical protein IPL53_05290 [Ignavibacteria bacterium]|nr:hypothetical protein [Ignavibacteria bacterium]